MPQKQNELRMHIITIPPAFNTMPHDIYKHQGALKLK